MHLAEVGFFAHIGRLFQAVTKDIDEALPTLTALRHFSLANYECTEYDINSHIFLPLS